MGKFMKGDIIVVPFPFTDLTGNRRRPAFVIANPDDDDVILRQITSVARNDHYAMPIGMADFESGMLPVKSFIRPNKIFTAAQHLILYSACQLYRSRLRLPDNVARESVFPKGKRTRIQEISIGGSIKTEIMQNVTAAIVGILEK